MYCAAAGLHHPSVIGRGGESRITMDCGQDCPVKTLRRLHAAQSVAGNRLDNIVIAVHLLGRYRRGIPGTTAREPARTASMTARNCSTGVECACRIVHENHVNRVRQHRRQALATDSGRGRHQQRRPHPRHHLQEMNATSSMWVGGSYHDGAKCREFSDDLKAVLEQCARRPAPKPLGIYRRTVHRAPPEDNGDRPEGSIAAVSVSEVVEVVPTKPAPRREGSRPCLRWSVPARASSLHEDLAGLCKHSLPPAESPRSFSRRQRSRTTSATLMTSPDASFSRSAFVTTRPVGRFFGTADAAH